MGVTIIFMDKISQSITFLQKNAKFMAHENLGLCSIV